MTPTLNMALLPLLPALLVLQLRMVIMVCHGEEKNQNINPCRLTNPEVNFQMEFHESLEQGFSNCAGKYITEEIY